MRPIFALFERLAASEAGQSIVELAIMAPLLLLLLAGAIDLGLFMFDGIEVGNAAGAGAQYGAQTVATAGDVTGITTAAQIDAQQISSSPSFTVNPTTFCACDSAQGTPVSCAATSPPPCPLAGDSEDLFVQVVVSYTVPPLLKLNALPSSITISRTAIQQVSPQ